MTPKSCCGSKGKRHFASCDNADGRLLTLESARRWFLEFGQNREVISNNGSQLFEFLLREVDRLKGKEAT